jgi:integrase
MAKRRKAVGRRKPGSGYINPLADGRAKAHYPKPSGGHFVKRCDTIAEAEEWLADLASRQAIDYDLAGGQQKLETWLNRWIILLETDPENPLKEKTIADYRFKLGYVIDLLGKAVLSEIKPDHADNAIRLIRKNLAQNTASQIHNLFWRAMEEAFNREYILRNPVKRPRRRKKRRRSDTARRQTYRLSPREAAALITAMSGRLEALAWWLMLILGLREGEVLGLRRGDLDLKNATITIAQQYTQLHGRAHHSTTKTDYSDRTLPFPRALVPLFEALLDTLTRRAALATKRGTWQEHSLLFPGKSGRPMNPSSLYHMLKRVLLGLHLPGSLCIHDLRHTAAKFYVDIGAPDNVRQSIAGHSPKSITDYYGETDAEAMRPWVEGVWRVLSGEREKARKEGMG